MLLQSGPRQIPAILVTRFVGFKGDGQRVTIDRSLPGRGEAQEAPEGETSVAGHQGEPIPRETGKEGRTEFGP